MDESQTKGSEAPSADQRMGADTYSSAIATAHHYMRWVLDPFRPYLAGTIVEVGIGHGSYFHELDRYGEYLGIDLDPRSVETARRRFPAANFLQADILQEGFLNSWRSEKADTIICINVLEHIEDDAMALANLIDALKVGGMLLISVPALMMLFSDLDRLAGHHRRYALADFRRLLADQPVHLEHLCYFNPIGGLGWWVNRLKRHHSLDSNSVNSQIQLFDKYILPISRLIDPLTRPFFGQSLTCIARRR